jgi:hypothetical protein
MSNIRYQIILGALFVVLLSAFVVERQRSCANGGGLCPDSRAWHQLPVSDLLLEFRDRRRAAINKALDRAAP